MHFEVKDTLLAQFCSGDQLAVEQVEQVLACICELELNLLALAADECLLTLGRTAIGGLSLLDAFDSVPAGAQHAHDVLVCDGQVLFLHVQACVQVGDDGLELLDDVFFFSSCLFYWSW